MGITVLRPEPAVLASAETHVALTATVTLPEDPARLVWTVSVNGSGACRFGQGLRAELICARWGTQPSASGIPGADVIAIEVCDPATGARGFAMLLLRQGGHLSCWDWDSSGQVTALRSRDDSVERFSYDAAGLITNWENAAGRMTRWNYDDQGFLANRMDEGSVTYFEVDRFGWVHPKNADFKSPTPSS